MKTLFLNRKPVEGPYGGGNLFVKAICEYAPKYGYRVTHHFEANLDAILMIHPHRDELRVGIEEIAYYKNLYPKTKIIHRINECDARKGTDHMDPFLRECSKITDISVFVSNWMEDYFSKYWWTNEKYVIYNGVDKDHFFKQKKIDNGKINLVTHHWSNNPMKGFDIYDKLDEWVGENEEYTFTYIGRERGTFKNSKVVSPLFGKELGEELGKYDIYISASRFDPGPNHVIEALACQIPTYAHRDGGGAVEFAGMDHVYGSFEDLIRIIKNAHYEPHGWDFSWEDCAKRYFEIID
jgi:glycosyltransferase involved in cell wall biosynthesis